MGGRGKGTPKVGKVSNVEPASTFGGGAVGASGGGVGEFENLSGARAGRMLAGSFNGIPTTTQLDAAKDKISMNKSLSAAEKATRINKIQENWYAKHDAHRALEAKIMAVNTSINISTKQGSNANFNDNGTFTQMSAVNVVNKLVSGNLKVNEVKIYNTNQEPASNGRAFHKGGNIWITNRQERHIIVHELAHAIERQNPIVLRNATKFYKQRTRGTKEISLNKLYKTNAYNNNEFAKPDKFMVKYMGKVYRPYGRIEATELISMGLEKMSKSATNLAVKDPHYFSMVYDSMRGRSWRSSIPVKQRKSRGIRKSKNK